MIEAVGLHKSYGVTPAVTDVHLRVAAGEVVAVLGPNGAGKTTTIEMLLGLRTPTRGRVALFGRAPQDLRVRERVGAMLQDTDAPETLTAAEVIDLVRHYYPVALPTGEVLERADLAGHATKRVSQLSGGQRQRLSFGLAIVGDPDLLFLDEPTASLDVQARQAFWRQVEEFARSGKTILFSTHNLAEADLAAGRIVVVAHGSVVHDGTPSEVRSLVPGKTVELVTDAAEAELASLPGVQQLAAVEGGRALRIPAGAGDLRRWRLQVSEPEPLLRALFRADRVVEELTVVEASLEQAFLRLTDESGGEISDAPRALEATTR